ncbi:hypothetical protein RCO27_12690 [Sphingosinicella sp. LHD-64]|uniref:hypothetical protein n=1 Tax=Sphingosinicella sp. LHD-64 TaxID=3072139 RepID=UPI00281055AF|nr:hypothetical protein [Sphingosinicella sp. LHD-64]MDQ8757083.1 hypothetical protein [Sphingosinicella sp. LHD-64]
MAAFHRTWLALLGTLTLLFAFGAFTEALACATACPTADHSRCDHPNVDSCAIVCHTLCTAAPSSAPSGDHAMAEMSTSFWGLTHALETTSIAPDPPPPRAA